MPTLEENLNLQFVDGCCENPYNQLRTLILTKASKSLRKLCHLSLNVEKKIKSSLENFSCCCRWSKLSSQARHIRYTVNGERDVLIDIAYHLELHNYFCDANHAQHGSTTREVRLT